jgi:hypothetical protein
LKLGAAHAILAGDQMEVEDRCLETDDSWCRKPTSPSPYIRFRNCFLLDESICGIPKVDKRCGAQRFLKRFWVCNHDALNIATKESSRGVSFPVPFLSLEWSRRVNLVSSLWYVFLVCDFEASDSFFSVCCTSLGPLMLLKAASRSSDACCGCS